MDLDASLVNSLGADAVKVRILDSVGLAGCSFTGEYADGSVFDVEDLPADTFEVPIQKPIGVVTLEFNGDNTPDVAVLEVSYLKNGASVGSSLVQHPGCALKLLKYKVELPRGAKVTLFDDETLEAQFVAWELPCPNTLPNMTFLQVKAANGFEQQITPSAGSYSVEVWTELGRRYAVFGEIWTYSFAQTLWFADLKVQLSNYEWQDCVPTAGEGGTIVTALPQ